MSDCRSDVVGLDAELRLCLVELAAANSEATIVRIGSSWTRFGEFAARSRITALANVHPTLATAFVRARTSMESQPGTATMHNRRTSLRLLFRTARRLGLAGGDPTLDLVLPPRAVGAYRPLTDDEVELCRDAALWWMSSQRFAAVWALAEATARGGELGAVRVRDVDLDRQRVWLSGSKLVEPRNVTLTNWGCDALQRRLATLERIEIGRAHV